MEKIHVIFYRARGTWKDASIRLLTGSLYSHCELVAPGQLGPVVETIGASKRDGNQVRKAKIDVESGHWDVLEYDSNPLTAWKRANKHLGKPYDTSGAILSASMLARKHKSRWFCSEIVAYTLGFIEPHEFSPGMLAAAKSKKLF